MIINNVEFTSAFYGKPDNSEIRLVREGQVDWVVEQKFEPEFFAAIENGTEVQPYHPFNLASVLKAHRIKRSTEVINHNELYLQNTPEEQSIVQGVIKFLELTGNPELEIDWKGPNGWAKGKLNDFTQLAITAGMHTQKAFSVEKFVMDKHTQIPFTTIEEALSLYDLVFDNN